MNETMNELQEKEEKKLAYVNFCLLRHQTRPAFLELHQMPQSKDIRVFFANMEKSDDQTSKKETSENFVIDLTD